MTDRELYPKIFLYVSAFWAVVLFAFSLNIKDNGHALAFAVAGSVCVVIACIARTIEALRLTPIAVEADMATDLTPGQ